MEIAASSTRSLNTFNQQSIYRRNFNRAVHRCSPLHHISRHRHRSSLHTRPNRQSNTPSTRIQAVAETSPAFTGWQHVMLATIDHHSLGDSLETAASIALSGKSKLSVLFLTEKEQGRDQAELMQLVQGHLEQRGIAAKDINILEETVEHSSGKVAVAIGEVADAVAADLVVLNTSAVHEHAVDANLLAEMVPSMVLLLP